MTPEPSEDEPREPADTDWPPPLAAPDSLLGKLQRGLGSGARAALASGSAAASTVLAAFATDPRCDRQIDERDDYYARLVLALGIEIEQVNGLLRTHHERTPADELDRDPVALGVLARLVQLGSDDAVVALRREAVCGRYWLSAIQALVDDPNFEPLPGWQQYTDGIAETVDARGPQWLVDSGCYLNPRDEPWQTWIPRHPGIRSAFAAAEATHHPSAPSTAGLDLASVSTGSLLELDGDRNLRSVALELPTRTTEEDRQALLAAARDQHHPMRAAAIRALAEQQRAELRPILLSLSEETAGPKVAGTMVRAFANLPPAITHDAAREWLAVSPDRYRRKAAAASFAAHGAGSAHGLIVTALAAELDAGADQYLICSLAEALGLAPEFGPYGVLARAFTEMQYSFGRRYVAEAIAASDSDFPNTLAVDCLWDAETPIRQLGATHVSLDDPAVAARLAALAADPWEDPDVRAAAARGEER